MKNIFKRLTLLSLGLLALVSCSKDGVKGTMFEQDSHKDGVTFYASKMNIQYTANYNGVIKVPVNRVNQDYGKTTVNVAIDAKLGTGAAPVGMFTLGTPSLIFDKGVSQMFVEIKVADISTLSPTSAYVVTLTLSDPANRQDSDFLSYGGKKAIAVTVQRQLTWVSLGTAKYVSQMWGKTFDVAIERAQEAPNMYRVLKMYDQVIVDFVVPNSTKGTNVIFTVTDSKVSTGGAINTGVDSAVIDENIGSLYAYYDGNVSSDGKFFTFSCDNVSLTNYYYVSGGKLYPVFNPGWAEQIQLP